MQAVHDPMATAPQAWRQRLHALIAERMRQPFGWGANDCCLFAADAVQAMTGRDPAAGLRGTYDDALSAARLVGKLGGMGAIGARAGMPIEPRMAQEGDVGLVEIDRRQMLAVCTGPLWLMPTAVGLGAMPLAAAQMAWRLAHE